MTESEPFVDLVKGEKFVWQGRPARLRIFRISDAVAAGWLVVAVGLTVVAFWSGFCLQMTASCRRWRGWFSRST